MPWRCKLLSSNRGRALCAAAALSVAASCGTVDPRPDFDKARQEIRATTGEESIHDPDDPVLTEDEIRAVLADGLGLAEATRLALLNNRRLQAGFLSLGVARADYVQAGLLKNPSLSLAFLFPDNGGRVRWTADLLQSVAEIWQIPARQALAQAGIERQILELSRFAGELVAATRAAYFESVAARGAEAVAKSNTEFARRSLEGVRKQVEIGVASNTDENLAESLALGAELSYRRSQREVAESIRELAGLLSFNEDVLTVVLTDPLPEPTGSEMDREAWVAASLKARPDVRAAESAVAAAEARVRVERRRFVSGASVGVSAERPEGGSSADLLVGPAASIEIPLFDQNQAQVSRAEYELGERTKEREALVAEVSQDVRAAVDKAGIAARAAAFSRSELVPQAERSAVLAARAYELGDTTILTLLQAQKAVLEARRTDIDALLEAALAKIDLERAAGAPLAGSAEAGLRP